MVSLLLYLTVPYPVHACSTSNPDWWWFTEVHEVDEDVNYPAGIWVRVLDRKSTNGNAQTQISIENHTTSSSMYILARNDILDQEDKIKQPDTGVPEGYTAITRLLISQSAHYDAANLQQVVPNFVDYNVQDPNRPDDFSLPPEQHGQILVLYDSQLFTVPFQVTYTLNPDYDPDSGKGCNSLVVLFLMPFIFLAEYPYLCYGPLIIASGWFIVKFSSQEKRPQK